MPAAKHTPGTLLTAETIELEPLLGSTWQGFRLIGKTNDQGEFQHNMWRRAFSAGELQALFYKSQHVEMLQRKTAQLQNEINKAHRQINVLENQIAFYRHELKAASKLGLMFSKLEKQNL